MNRKKVGKNEINIEKTDENQIEENTDRDKSMKKYEGDEGSVIEKKKRVGDVILTWKNVSRRVR